MNNCIIKIITIIGSFIICFTCNAQSQQAQEIQGIVLLSDEDQMIGKEQAKRIEGLDASRIRLPGSIKTLQENLRSAYKNQPWNEKTLRAIKQQIYKYYQEEEYP